MKKEEIKSMILEIMKSLNIDRMPTSAEIRNSKISKLDGIISKNNGYIYWAKELNLQNKKPVTIWNKLMIEEEILKTMKILNINRMPTSQEVRSLNISGLDSAISNSGGYVFWANNLDLANKKPTIQWSENEVKNKILELVTKLNLKRMPTRAEVLNYYKNNSLHSAIVRTYGYFGWAKLLGLEMKYSETLMGMEYQNICIEQLKRMGYDVQPSTTKSPYDIVVNDNIRIDVKSGCAYEMRGSRVHSFGINKKQPTCDIYIIYALNETAEKIERIFIIPSNNLKVVSLCIGKNSKYNKFLDRWDYIKTYDTFYKSLD